MTASRNLSVGVFVTAALMVGIAITIWITGRNAGEPTTMYSIMIEDDVSGLMPGGPVQFLGVRIGDVTAMTIEPGDPARIRVDIRVHSSAPVNQGTWATLVPQGITGVSVINLSNDTGQHPPLEAPANGAKDDYPQIPYRSSGLTAIMSSAPRVVDKMEELLDRASGMLNGDNREALERSLANIEALTQSLAEQEVAIASLPETFNAAMAEFRDTIGRADTLLEQAGPDAVNALDSLSAAATQLSDTLARLDAWTANNEADLNEFAANGLGQMPELVGELRQAARDLQKLLARIQDDPSRFIYKTDSDAVEVED